MVGFAAELRDVVLFGPQRSLLLSVAHWASRHEQFPLRLVSSRKPEHIRSAVQRAAYVIVDATAEPAAAAEILDHVLDSGGEQMVLVYSETMHPDLEMHVRQRAVGFVLGPLQAEQWQDVLSGVAKIQAVQ